MANGVEFKDNSKQVLAQMEKNIAQALYRIGLKWMERVRPLIPVDTSNLLKSATYEVDIVNKRVVVGIKQAGTYATTEYGPFVELGTRKMAAQPYLKPSVMNYINDYKAEIQKALGAGWGVSVDVSSVSY